MASPNSAFLTYVSQKTPVWMVERRKVASDRCPACNRKISESCVLFSSGLVSESPFSLHFLKCSLSVFGSIKPLYKQIVSWVRTRHCTPCSELLPSVRLMFCSLIHHPRNTCARTTEQQVQILRKCRLILETEHVGSQSESLVRELKKQETKLRVRIAERSAE